MRDIRSIESLRVLLIPLLLALASCSQGPGDDRSCSIFGGCDTACPLDAKICPGGESVGREGPNCEFPACPEVVSCRGPADEPVPCPDGYSCVAFGRGGMCFSTQTAACRYYCDSPICAIEDHRVSCGA